VKKNLRCKLCGNKRKKAHEKNPKKWCEGRQKDWVGFPQEDVSTIKSIDTSKKLRLLDFINSTKDVEM